MSLMRSFWTTTTYSLSLWKAILDSSLGPGPSIENPKIWSPCSLKSRTELISRIMKRASLSVTMAEADLIFSSPKLQTNCPSVLYTSTKKFTRYPPRVFSPRIPLRRNTLLLSLTARYECSSLKPHQFLFTGRWEEVRCKCVFLS